MFEASIDRLIRLGYPEAPEDFQTRFAIQTFTDGVQENEMCIRDRPKLALNSVIGIFNSNTGRFDT